MIDGVVIDTDVFSYLLKQDSRRSKFQRHLKGKRPALSVMSLAEIRRWPRERKWGVAKTAILEESLAGHAILPLTARTADIWARIFMQRKQAGRPMSVADCWIAASAIEFGLPLLTHNNRDFAGIPDLMLIMVD